MKRYSKNVTNSKRAMDNFLCFGSKFMLFFNFNILLLLSNVMHDFKENQLLTKIAFCERIEKIYEQVEKNEAPLDWAKVDEASFQDIFFK